MVVGALTMKVLEDSISICLLGKQPRLAFNPNLHESITCYECCSFICIGTYRGTYV